MQNNMTLNEYQKIIEATALPICKEELFYNVLGLCGESGEVADKIKKIYRDKDGLISVEDKKQIVKELGDVLWYLSMLAAFLGITLEEVANRNIFKCKARMMTNTLHGEGDDREITKN